MVALIDCSYNRSILTNYLDSEKPQKCHTTEEEAYNFVELLFKRDILEYTDIVEDDLKNKRFLDVGMGNGNILHYTRKLLGVDTYGVDISYYLERENYISGITFPNTDVRDLSKDLLGTFGVSYQASYSVPMKDTIEVLLAISKTLKPNGYYYSTFQEEYLANEDSYVMKILRDIYEKVKFIKYNGILKGAVIASKPFKNPNIGELCDYCCVISNEELDTLLTLGRGIVFDFVDKNKEERIEFLKKIKTND